MIYPFCIIAVVILHVSHSQAQTMIDSFSEILEQFESCNIRITAVWDFNEIEFEPFLVPVILFESWKRARSSRSDIYQIPIHQATHMFAFKLRESRCFLELVFHLAGIHPLFQFQIGSLYYDHKYQRIEYMDDKYLVMVRHETDFLVENHQFFFNQKGLMDHRIFMLTIPSASQGQIMELNNVHRFLIQRIFFISMICLEYVNCTVTVSPAPEPAQHSVLRHQMDLFAASTRKKLFWIPRPVLSYGKLNRRIKLPYDERNLNRDADPNFYQFIENLIDRSNISRGFDMNFMMLSSYQLTKENYNFVPDETDDFNFITCATLDSFWSIAELFQRPFQPLVWACLGIAILTTGITVNVFKRSKLMACILFNLIEVFVRPRSVQGGVKILFAFWLLASVVLTHSYKGLIIAYLSAPWEPHQDFNYFEQVKDFQLFSPVAYNKENLYWKFCEADALYLARNNKSCHALNTLTEVKEYTTYSLFLLPKTIRISNRTLSLSKLFHYDLLTFPRNESKEMFKTLVSGAKVLIVGLKC